jgi:ligand-binding sensor domain-containing protein
VLTGSSGLPSKEVNSVLPQGSRYAWAATDEGLVYVDADRQMVLNTWGSQSGLPSSIVSSLSMGRSGILFVGTASGLAYIQNDAVTAVDEINCNIQTLQCDKLGSVWVASSDGLKRYFRSSGTVEEYTPFNSPLPQCSIYSISIDDSGGYLWLATDHGLWRGELETGLSGDGSGASVYPDPFLPGTGAVLGIAGIPDEPALIRVFDLTGTLVYEYSSQGRDDFAWDGTAEDGSQVASGVYMIMVDGGSYGPVLSKFTLVR